MKNAWVVLFVLFLLNCGNSAPAPTKHEAQETKATAQAALVEFEKGSLASPTPTPTHKTKKKLMDNLEVETDTASWVVGKVGIVTVLISEESLTPGSEIDVNLGVDQIPKSEYYLVALDGAYSDTFSILPSPGQQPKQHRARAGLAATWRYQVRPIKDGEVDLLFTLRVYENSQDQAGTDISIRPWHIRVVKQFPSSYLFLMGQWVKNNGGWGPIFTVIATLMSAGAVTEWLRRRKNAAKRKLHSHISRKPSRTKTTDHT